MFVVVKLGATQYKIAEGDTIVTNRMKEEEGNVVTLDNVLLFENGADIRVGQPILKEIKVTAKVLKHHLGVKTVAFKYRRRKDSSTKKGHRQRLTSLNITKISA